MAAVPAEGVTRPSSMRSVVVLPAPFGPRKAVTVPSPTLKLRSSTAVAAPKRLVSPRASMTGMPDNSLIDRKDATVAGTSTTEATARAMIVLACWPG